MSWRTQLQSGACQAGLEGRLIASLLPPPKFFCAGRLFLNAASITPNRAVALKQGTHPPRRASSQPAGNRKGLFSFFFFSCLRLNIQMVLWAEYSGCMNVYIRGPKVPRFLCLWPKEHCVLTLCPFASGGSRDTWRSFWLCPGSHQTPTP